MNGVIRTELLKLTTTRTMRYLALAGLAVAALLGAATAGTAGQDGAAPLGSAASLANALGVSAMPGFLLLIAGVLASAGEYQHRTITQTFLATPHRGRVIAAKLVAVAGAAVPVAVAMMAVAFLAMLPRVVADGAGLDLLDGAVATAVGGTVLAAALFGIAGVALGALVRSQLAAVVVIGAWIVVGEGVIGIVAGEAGGRWLPGRAASVIAGSDVPGLPLWGAALLLAAYSAAVASVAAGLTLRRDVS